MTTLLITAEQFREVVEENERLKKQLELYELQRDPQVLKFMGYQERVARLEDALKAFTGPWLTWPAKKQPDPRVTLYESRTVREIQEHAQKALEPNPL